MHFYVTFGNEKWGHIISTFFISIISRFFIFEFWRGIVLLGFQSMKKY